MQPRSKMTERPLALNVGHFSLNYARVLVAAQHENSNDIAQIVDSSKGQTVVCTLYGSRCCLLSCLHTATAALWARDRSATRRRRAVYRSREHPDRCRVRRGRDR